MGVWIETSGQHTCQTQNLVTPCMGVWIETRIATSPFANEKVTPCMGVWIETNLQAKGWEDFESHPVWVCGLKLILVI